MKFEFITDLLIINNQTVDAICVSEYNLKIPIPSKSAEISIVINSVKEKQLIGSIRYRAIKINDESYNFHQFRHEGGRPQLLKEVMDLLFELITKST